MRAWVTVGALTLLCLLIWTSAASAYEILLDIDTDNDPTTLHTLSQVPMVMVKIVLWPSFPGEQITDIFFGLGGTCWECEGVFDYGTDFDLIPEDGNWTTHPELVGSWASAMCINCCGNPGFHYIYEATAINGSFTLQEPVFLATFSAWQSQPMWGRCPVPPSNLAAFSAQGDFWNYLQIGGEAPITIQADNWGDLKGRYRSRD